MAALLEHEAEIDIAARRYRSALAALDRAIRAPWTAPKAYLLKAVALRNAATGPPDHARVLALLDTAATRSPPPEPRIDAVRALVHLRQNRPAAARRSLGRCIETIDAIQSGPWDDTAEPYATLRTWATTMAARLHASPVDRSEPGDRTRSPESTEGGSP